MVCSFVALMKTQQKGDTPENKDEAAALLYFTRLIIDNDLNEFQRIRKPNLQDQNPIENNNNSRLIYLENIIPESEDSFKATLDLNAQIYSIPKELDKYFSRDLPTTKLTAWHIMAFFDSLEFIVDLAPQKEEVNIKSFDGYSPLHYGIIGESFESIQYLVSAGADVEEIVNEKTCLYMAVSTSNIELVNFFLDNGLSLRPQDIKSSNSTFTLATLLKNIDILSLLLTKGLNFKKYQNISPLTQAVAIGFNQAIKPLIMAGSNPNTEQNEEYPILIALKRGNEEAVDILLENGAKINVFGAKKAGPVHYATLSGDVKLVEKVLSYGGDIMELDLNQKPSTFYALTLPPLKQKEMLSFLFQKGIDINWRDSEGSTLLSEILLSHDSNMEEMVNFLLDEHADADVTLPHPTGGQTKRKTISAAINDGLISLPLSLKTRIFNNIAQKEKEESLKRKQKNPSHSGNERQIDFSHFKFKFDVQKQKKEYEEQQEKEKLRQEQLKQQQAAALAAAQSRQQRRVPQPQNPAQQQPPNPTQQQAQNQPQQQPQNQQLQPPGNTRSHSQNSGPQQAMNQQMVQQLFMTYQNHFTQQITQNLKNYPQSQQPQLLIMQAQQIITQLQPLTNLQAKQHILSALQGFQNLPLNVMIQKLAYINAYYYSFVYTNMNQTNQSKSV